MNKLAPVFAALVALLVVAGCAETQQLREEGNQAVFGNIDNRQEDRSDCRRYRIEFAEMLMGAARQHFAQGKWNDGITFFRASLKVRDEGYGELVTLSTAEKALAGELSEDLELFPSGCTTEDIADLKLADTSTE